MNNPARKQNVDGNLFLKPKTLASLTARVPLANRDFSQKEYDVVDRRYVQYLFEDLKHVIRWAVNTNANVNWLVLFASGTIIENQEDFRMWLDLLPDAQTSPVAAFSHLQVPTDFSSLEIHTQALAINACVARRFKSQILGSLGKSGIMSLKAIRSKKDFHDGYTPYWVRSGGDSRDVHVGESASWLVPLINEGCSVYNFSDETLRRAKRFFYLDKPEMQNLCRMYQKGEKPELLIQEAKNLGREELMQRLLYLDDIPQAAVLVSNTTKQYTEFLPKEPCFKAVLLPAAGFNFASIDDHFSGKVEQFFHYDISDEAIKFRKDLLTDWDGQGFLEYFNKIPPIELFYGNPESIQDLENWKVVQSKKHNFFEKDILVSWRELLSEVKSKGYDEVLFDLSNILTYHRSFVSLGFDGASILLKEIIDFLKENFSRWCLKTDLFSLSHRDMEIFESEGLYSPNRKTHGLGYLLYKIKTPILPGVYNQTWENANVDFEAIVRKPNEFSRKTKQAFHDIKGQFQSWHDFYEKSYLPAVILDLKFDHEKMLDEARKAYEKGLFTYHRNKGDWGWASFVIHGLGFGKTHNYHHYYPGEIVDYSRFQFVEEAEKECPEITRFFRDSFPEQAGIHRFARVRIMALEPGGIIFPHYDSPDSTQPGPINMALNNPKNCHFHMWKGSNYTFQSSYGRLPFVAGRAINVDIGNSHMVYNLSDEVRFHLIAHVVVDGEDNGKYFNFKYNSLKKMMEPHVSRTLDC